MADTERAWICVRTLRKSEHIAAASLRQLNGVDAFCPRLRYRKKTRRGVVWFTDAMFPCYIFVYCDVTSSLSAVRYARGVAGLVDFAGKIPVIPNEQLDALKNLIGEEEVCQIDETVGVGDTVEVTEGPLMGLSAVVTKVLPAKERVYLLLEFLGQEREVEVPLGSVLQPGRPKLDR